MKIIKPYKFDTENKKIGVVNTSSTPCTFPNRLKRALDTLSDKGFKIILPDHFSDNDGYLPGTPSNRVNDLMYLVNNKDVGLILSSTGGLSTIEILELIDFDKIKEQRKIFCGFSDFTVLLIAIHVKTGLVTFYGPSLLPNFGEYGGVNTETFKSFQMNIQGNNGYRYEMPALFSRETQYWDREDNTKLVYERFPELDILVCGKANGKIIAGNLESLVVLAGTEYMPCNSNTPFVLFLENTASDTAALKRDLTHLELCGFFKNISGIIYGLPAKKVNRGGETIEKVLIDSFNKYKIPVIFGFPFGHINPNFTIPIGCDVEIDASNESVAITILEHTVE